MGTLQIVRRLGSAALRRLSPTSGGSASAATDQDCCALATRDSSDPTGARGVSRLPLRLPYFDLILARLEEGDAGFAQAFGRHVHWGFWEDPETADGTVPDFVRASERLCRRLLATARVSDGQTILDVGCGFGGTLATLNELLCEARLHGLNIDERQLARARTLAAPRGGNRIAFVQGEAGALPFAGGSVDRVLAVECIFHFPSRARFFSEAWRALRPGGRLVLSDFLLPRPAGQPDPETLRLIERVERFYGPSSFQTLEEYRALADASGFSLAIVDDITPQIVPSYAVARRLLGRVSDEAAWATGMIESELASGSSRYAILTFDRRRP